MEHVLWVQAFAKALSLPIWIPLGRHPFSKCPFAFNLIPIMLVQRDLALGCVGEYGCVTKVLAPLALALASC